MIDLTPIEKNALYILHLAMSSDAVFEPDKVEKLSGKQWRELFALLTQQGVLSLAYDGMRKFYPEFKPDETVALNWKLLVAEQEETYAKHCRMIAKLHQLCTLHGIRMTLIKGVGLSTLYPVPNHRRAGDIDIFTDSLDTAKLSHKEANRLIETLLMDEGAIYHLPNPRIEGADELGFVFHDIMIENHRCVLTMGNRAFVAQLQQKLDGLFQPREMQLGELRVLVPSAEFNRLYLPFHTATHFSGEGFTLHNICDWYCFVQKYGHVPNLTDNATYNAYMNALTEVCTAYFSLKNIAYVATGKERKLADRLMSEVLHRPYVIGNQSNSRLSIFMNKWRHFFYIRKNAELSIGHDSTLKLLRNGIVANLKDGRIFKSHKP